MTKPLFETSFPQGIFSLYHQLQPTFVTTNQVHGALVLNLCAPELEPSHATRPTADGLYWNWEQWREQCSKGDVRVPVAITADCLPVLLLGKKGGALVHAGWRGVKQRIYLDQSILEQDIHSVYIGPSIAPQSFEVSEDFRAEFPGSAHFFKHSQGHLCFNLQAQVRSDLQEALKGDLHFFDAKINTVTTLSLHSYRRDRPQCLRNYNCFFPSTHKDL